MGFFLYKHSSVLDFLQVIVKEKSSGLIWIEKLAALMDSKFTFPGTKFKFGLDPIIGLVPIFGDLTSFAISGVLLIYMAKYGASRKVLILMVGNIVLDTVVGSIPILGNIFDFAYKANNRNIRLLKKHYQEGKYQGSGRGIIVTLIIALVLVMALIILILIALTKVFYEFLLSFF